MSWQRPRPRSPRVLPPEVEALFALTSNPVLDALADVAIKTAAPLVSAPPPEQGTAGVAAHYVNAALGVLGAPFELLDTGFALLTSGVAAAVPGQPAATLGSLHVGTPHAHAHPPSNGVPLPSLGAVAGPGCRSVLIGGMPAARAGDLGPAPTCGSTSPMFEVYTGSSNVFVGGSRAARQGDLTRHCNPASLMKMFGAALQAVGVAAGGITALASAAEGNAAASQSSALQAAAEAQAMTMSAFLGKDPGLPPAMGMITTGSGSVFIGGFPMPDVLDVVSGLAKIAKAGAAALKLGKRFAKLGPQVCLNPGDPVSVTTGEVYRDFADYDVGAGELVRFTWSRHYKSTWADEHGAFGRGFRCNFDKRLSLLRTRAIFFDHDGLEVEIPRDPDSDRHQGIAFGYRLAQPDDFTFELERPTGERLRFRRISGSEAALVELDAGERGWGAITLVRDHHGQLKRLEQATPNGRVETRLRYDELGHVVAVDRFEPGRPRCTIASYRYDERGRVIESTDAAGHTTRYTWDPSDRLTRFENAEGYGFRFAYDGLGRCIASAGDDGLWWITLRYQVGRTFVTEGDGGEWTYLHNEDGLVTEVTDPAGGLRQYRINELGLIAREVDPTGAITEWLYDESHANVGRRDPFGRRLQPERDDPRPTSAHELDMPEEPRVQQLGTIEASEWPIALPPILHAEKILAPAHAHHVHACERDAAGRVLTAIDAAGHREQFRYGALGGWIERIDADGRTHRRELGSWDLVHVERDPLGHARRYAYTHREQVASIVDARGNAVEYDYDPAGRLAAVWTGEGPAEGYAYDASGQLLRKLAGDGSVLVEYEPGPRGQPRSRTLATGEVERFAYDPRGFYAEASTREHGVRLEHDARGRVVTDLRDGVGVEHAIRDGELVSTTILGRFTIAYDRDGGTTRITTPEGSKHAIRAARDGLVERVHANGSIELSRFDERGRCVARLVGRGRGRATWWLRNHFTPAGDLVLVEDQRRGRTHYRTDVAHRLVSQRKSDGTCTEYEHDAAGNLVRNRRITGMRFDARNRLYAAEGFAFRHDVQGNLIEQANDFGPVVRYGYDALDRLVRVEGNDGRPPWRASYDGLSRRIEKVYGEQHTRYVWDGHRLAAELGPAGLRVYVYASRDALVPIAFVDYDGPEAEPSSGRVHVVFTDHLGMPSFIEDGMRRPVWYALESDPWGELAVHPGSSIRYDLRWPGHVFDPETGLHYNRFRTYSPELGRYLQPDPLGQLGGLNLYAYASNPLVAVDVLGLSVCKKKKGATQPVADAAGPRTKQAPDPNAKKPDLVELDDADTSGLPRRGGDSNAPGINGKLGRDKLTSEQRTHFRKRIDAAENAKDADSARQARYDRNCCARANRGQPPEQPRKWVKKAETVDNNRERGSTAEQAVLDALELENNNHGNPKVHAQEEGAGTRPDALTDRAVVEVKSMSDDRDPKGRTRVLCNSPQLDAQRDMARGSKRKHVVVMTNENKDNCRPSGPLAHRDEGSTVLHRDKNTGKWSKWDPEENRWESIDRNKAKKIVGEQPNGAI